MKGSHRIIVESRKVKYDFVIQRNITIITGDSGSGKTVLIELERIYGKRIYNKEDVPGKIKYLTKVKGE